MPKMIVVLCASLGLIAACAQPGKRLEGEELDLVLREQKLDCPMTKAPVCVERMGKPTHCYCASRDSLELLLEPMKPPTGADWERR